MISRAKATNQNPATDFKVLVHHLARDILKLDVTTVTQSTIHRFLRENKLKRKSRACVNLKLTVIWLVENVTRDFCFLFVDVQELLEPVYRSSAITSQSWSHVHVLMFTAVVYLSVVYLWFCMFILLFS